MSEVRQRKQTRVGVLQKSRGNRRTQMQRLRWSTAVPAPLVAAAAAAAAMRQRYAPPCLRGVLQPASIAGPVSQLLRGSAVLASAAFASEMDEDRAFGC